jgi:hypothetical protein
MALLHQVGGCIDAARRSIVLQQAGGTSANMALGCALTAGSAWTCAHTVTPFLLQLVDSAASIGGVFDQLYGVGPMLSAALGLGGVYGYVSAASVLMSIVNTLLTSEGRFQTRVNWTCAHLAVGLALAPLLTLPVPVASSLVVCASACTLGLSYVLTSRLSGERPSWEGAVMGVCLGLATAPMGAMAAMGMPAGSIFGNAAKFIGAGVTAIAVLSLWLNGTKMANDTTAYLNRFVQPTPGNCRLDWDGEPVPDVFGCTKGISNLIRASQAYMPKPIGRERLLLDGASGPNRRLVAHGIAHALGVPLYGPSHADLMAGSSAAINVQQLFNEARLKSRSTRLPVVLFFANAEMIFNDPSMRDAFLTCLEGVPRHTDTNLLVIASTSKPQSLYGPIRQRFNQTATIRPNTRDELGRLFASKWDALTKAAPLVDPQAVLIPANQLSLMATRAAACGFDDDDLEGVLQSAIKAVVARQSRRLDGDLSAEELAADSDTVMRELLAQAFDAACRVKEQAASSQQRLRPTVATGSKPAPPLRLTELKHDAAAA